MIYQGSNRYPVHDIVVHCSDTRPNWMEGARTSEKIAEIRRWHTDPKPNGRGWRDIGYHWIIDRDGTAQAGRREMVIGAGVMGFNAGVIHICLIGGHGGNEKDRFSKHFTNAQDLALQRLIAAIKSRTEIKRVTGHNDHAAKACPCFTVSEYLRGLR